MECWRPVGYLTTIPCWDSPPLFMDAAWDSLHGEDGYRVGLFSPHMGTHVEWLGQDISLGNRSRRLNQQIVELWGVWTAVKFACRVRWRGVTLFWDNANAGAIYQGVRGRASVGCGFSSGCCGGLTCFDLGTRWWCILFSCQAFCSRQIPCPGWRQCVRVPGRRRRRRRGRSGGGLGTISLMPCSSGLWPDMWERG